MDGLANMPFFVYLALPTDLLRPTSKADMWTFIDQQIQQQAENVLSESNDQSPRALLHCNIHPFTYQVLYTPLHTVFFFFLRIIILFAWANFCARLDEETCHLKPSIALLPRHPQDHGTKTTVN